MKYVYHYHAKLNRPRFFSPNKPSEVDGTFTTNMKITSHDEYKRLKDILKERLGLGKNDEILIASLTPLHELEDD